MVVYALMGAIDYEGDTLLGVYSTEDAARAAKRQYDYDATVLSRYDRYWINETEVDAAARPYYG